MLLLCGCSYSENQGVEEPQKSTVQTVVDPTGPIDAEPETTTVELTAEESDDSIIFEEDGKLMAAQGTINEIFCFLPGYKKIPIDKGIIKAELEQVFVNLEKAEKRISEGILPRLDGAGMKINYDYEGQKISLELRTTYENNCTMVSISGGEIRYMEMLVSGEVFRFVHELSGWKEFDVTQLNTITSMTAQIAFGYQANNQVVTFSEEETRKLMNKFIRSAEVSEEGGCGYNVRISLYRDEVLLYQGYLAGDRCTEIGLESQHFHIDSDILKEIYIKLDYDMPVGNIFVYFTGNLFGYIV